MEAITTFEQHYNDLGYYMATDRQSGHVGQCPTGGLVSMLTCMENELKNLVLDLDKMDQAILHKIADHTVALNRLNHQAQILFM